MPTDIPVSPDPPPKKRGHPPPGSVPHDNRGDNVQTYRKDYPWGYEVYGPDGTKYETKWLHPDGVYRGYPPQHPQDTTSSKNAAAQAQAQATAAENNAARKAAQLKEDLEAKKRSGIAMSEEERKRREAEIAALEAEAARKKREAEAAAAAAAAAGTDSTTPSSTPNINVVPDKTTTKELPGGGSITTYGKEDQKAGQVGSFGTDNSFSKPPPMYTGGAKVVKTVWLPNGARLDYTSTGQVIETAPGGNPYNVTAAVAGKDPADRTTQASTPAGSAPATAPGDNWWANPAPTPGTRKPAAAAPPVKDVTRGSSFTPPDRDQYGPMPTASTPEPKGYSVTTPTATGDYIGDISQLGKPVTDPISQPQQLFDPDGKPGGIQMY